MPSTPDMQQLLAKFLSQLDLIPLKVEAAHTSIGWLAPTILARPYAGCPSTEKDACGF